LWKQKQKTMITITQQTQKRLNFLDAESLALNLAYKDFFGDNQPIGIAFTFITDRKNGKEWRDDEKKIAKYISELAIRELKRKHLEKFITTGIVPDCAMARRFMATGSGQTAAGYNF
jgi:hypothetical protein